MDIELLHKICCKPVLRELQKLPIEQQVGLIEELKDMRTLDRDHLFKKRSLDWIRSHKPLIELIAKFHIPSSTNEQNIRGLGFFDNGTLKIAKIIYKKTRKISEKDKDVAHKRYKKHKNLCD